MEPVPAQILSFEEVNILGNILNNTFGKASTQDKGYSVKHSLQGSKLVLKYNAIVHFNDTDGLMIKLQTQKENLENKLEERLRLKNSVKEMRLKLFQ